VLVRSESVDGSRQLTSVEPASTPRVHVNLLSADPDRRAELLHRLGGDPRFTLAARGSRPDAEHGVVALDVAGGERYAAELIGRLTSRQNAPAVLAFVEDEDDLDLAGELLLAGAAGIASLRQPSEGLCQAVVDVAAGLASVSPALETHLVRRLQALPPAA
jgi:hypothetical protein